MQMYSPTGLFVFCASHDLAPYFIADQTELVR